MPEPCKQVTPLGSGNSASNVISKERWQTEQKTKGQWMGITENTQEIQVKQLYDPLTTLPNMNSIYLLL